MPASFLEAIHRVASVGWVYDAIQVLAGAPVTRALLRRHLRNCRGRVLDIEGGTGSLAECSYTCLDNEMPKLRRCATKVPGSPLLADATYMPVRTGSIDTVTCAKMTHHFEER